MEEVNCWPPAHRTQTGWTRKIIILTLKYHPVSSPPINQKDVHKLIRHPETLTLPLKTLPLREFGSFEHKLPLLFAWPHTGHLAKNPVLSFTTTWCQGMALLCTREGAQIWFCDILIIYICLPYYIFTFTYVHPGWVCVCERERGVTASLKTICIILGTPWLFVSNVNITIGKKDCIPFLKEHVVQLPFIRTWNAESNLSSCISNKPKLPWFQYSSFHFNKWFYFQQPV